MREVPNNQEVEDMKKLRLVLISALAIATILWSTSAVLLLRPSTGAISAASPTFDYRAKWICNAPSLFPNQFVTAWGSYGNGNGQFAFPLGIAVDSSSGNVYVTDNNNNRVQKFTSTGGFITSWGSFGTGNGQFNSPTGLAVDSAGDVYVVDLGNSRVQMFTGSGGFVTSWGSSGSGNGQFSGARGVAVDFSGDVYVTDQSNNRVQKFSSTGGFITSWGSAGTGNGQFSAPAGVAVHSSGNVYVVDQFNARVQIFAIGEQPNAERIGLVPGEYMTDINVHNPSHSITLKIQKKFVLSTWEPEYRGFNTNVTISAVLKPDGAFFTDCKEILTALRIPLTLPAKGFVILTTTITSLDVVAEYSQLSATGSSLDVERIAAQSSVA